MACCYGSSSAVCWSVTVVNPAIAAELNKMSFGMWSSVGPRKHALDGSARQRHQANIIEPSMCGGDAALCQEAFNPIYGGGGGV